MNGRLVVFEGIDGCGKQTQITMLAKLLVEKDIRFSLFKYPTQKAEKVHAYLDGKIKPKSTDELLSWYADDIASEQEELSEACDEGWAICDRYVFSTAAYQGTGGKLDACMKKLSSKKWLVPDTVIWLDLGVDEAMGRKGRQKTPDVHEKDRKFLSEVRENYSELYSRKWLCQNWKKIDASPKKEGVFASVRLALGL